MRPFAVSTAVACYCSYVDGELCWPVVGRLYTGDVGTAVVDARQPRLPAISGNGVTARRLTSASVNHSHSGQRQCCDPRSRIDADL